MTHRNFVPLVAVLLLTGCDFPTELPQWDQTWVVPVERIRIGVAELLPQGIELSPDSSVFLAETPEAILQVSLAELCGSPCVLATGTRAPKPEFSDTLSTEAGLPADLVSATLAGGSIDAVMEHSFSFDPLRPSSDPGAEYGYLLLEVTSAGNVVAFDSIDGADQAFPSSVTLTPSLPVQPVGVTDTVDIRVAIFSPAGDSTTIDATDTLGVRFAPSTVEIAEATVAASDLPVDSVSTTLTFGGLDSTAVSRVQSGALRFRVQNPFEVTGTLDMTFRGDFPTIEHQLAVQAGDYTDRLEFTGAEVQEILLSDQAEVVASGSASAPDGTLTVLPSDVMLMDSEFELSVLLGPLESTP